MSESSSGEMKAVFLRNGKITFEDRQIPTPGPGQVLVKSKSCGICGSDLHFYSHGDELFALQGVESPPDVFLGHEYCAEIVAFGPETGEADGRFEVGQRVCSIPFIEAGDTRIPIGTNQHVYGAYSEYFLLSESLLLAVPDGLADEAVALVEPLAVGIHAVSRSNIGSDAAALVCGCGPIGLATISALKKRGVRNIVASDPTLSRRKLALQMGASDAVDPLETDVMARLVEQESENRVIFECVGIHMMIPELIASAPPKSTIVFAGVHTKDTTFNPMMAMVKELDIKFTFYYENSEYEDALNLLASGDLQWQPLVTGTVGYDGIQGAFETLLSPNNHVKIMIEPWRTGQLEKI